MSQALRMLLYIPKEFTSTVPFSLLEQVRHNQFEYIIDAHVSMGVKEGGIERQIHTKQKNTYVGYGQDSKY